MVQNSKECLDTFTLAATYWAQFLATGFHHFTSEDVFCPAGIQVRKDQIERMEKNNKERSAGIAFTDKAKKLKLES